MAMDGFAIEETARYDRERRLAEADRARLLAAVDGSQTGAAGPRSQFPGLDRVAGLWCSWRLGGDPSGAPPWAAGREGTGRGTA